MAKILALVVLFLSVPFSVQGFSLDWKGLYRFEFVELTNTDMNSQNGSKSYGLQNLTLSPHIIAADGLEIHGRFNLFRNSEYSSSNIGGFFGQGLGDGTSSDSFDSNTLSQQMSVGGLAVNELYFSWVRNYSALTVGRAPVSFGLGMMFSAGSGEFDHWLDNRDLVAYKMISGNMSYVPMLAKVNEGLSGSEDDVTDYIFNVNYDNKDAGLKMGLFYQTRVATLAGNDTPRDSLGRDTATGQTFAKGWKTEDINLFVEREYKNSRFGIELGLQKGDTGVESGGENVSLQGLGVATEWDYQASDSRFQWGLRAGYASGDNPGTEAYEGYIFDKNYDVAMLLFNHPLGQANVFRTHLDRISNKSSSERIDDQALSNVMYFAPRVQWNWSESLAIRGVFTYGKLLKESIANSGASLDLGYEFDLALISQPYKNFKWVTELGFMLPGKSFSGGSSQNFEKKQVYGIITKAAISF